MIENQDQKAAASLPTVHELIRHRWSPRSFSEQEVTMADLCTVLDAARWAASSYNEQPWRFLVGRKQDPAAYQTMLGLLAPFNQAWAKSAPVLILIVAKKNFTHNNTPNAYAVHDAGAALAQLALQATALGLHVHGMAGFDRDKARTELKIPDDYEFAAFSALGYLGPAENLPAGQLRDQEVAPRTRKPLAELAFTGTFGSALPLG